MAEKFDVKLKSWTLTLIDDAKSKKCVVVVCVCTYVCIRHEAFMLIKLSIMLLRNALANYVSLRLY